MGKKATVAEAELRVTEVMGMLLEGKSRPFILQHAAATWDLATRTTDEYIKLARVQIEEHAATTRENEFSVAMLRLGRLFELALHIHDYKTCLAVQKEINTLFGQYPAVKQETTGDLTIKIVRGNANDPN